MKRIFIPLMATAVAAGALAACTQAPIPRDMFYRLSVEEPAQPLTAQPVFQGPAEVQSLSADGVLGERPIVYTEPGSETLLQYSYHFWSERPTDAVARELAGYLRGAGLFPQVVTSDIRVPPDYEVQGRIQQLEQRLTPQGANVAVSLNLAANKRRGMDLLLHQTYREEEPAADRTPEAAAAAARRALARIFDRFAADLAAASPTG